MLLADAGEIGDWAGDTNATSADPYDPAGSDWHRVMLDSLDDDVVEVDLGAGRRGLGVTMGENGWHTVFRTPTGLLMATRKGGPAADAEFPTAAGSVERLLSSDAFWDFIAAPLTKPFQGGTLHVPSGWLMIMSAIVPTKDLHRDGSPVDVAALLDDAEQSGTDVVEVGDGYGGRALLVRVGPTALSAWFEPQRSDPALGIVDRCELRFGHERPGLVGVSTPPA
ncbi:hypothetical protein Cs7R123_44920 [Catellatospora sp. TT07R-123]|nr:hypothetical protein Cs7R123_44920 [Catellatospora sp. TT07R-123]